MLVVTRYRVGAADAAAFRRDAAAALQVLVASPGCTGAHLGRAVDQADLWTLTTTWESVGAYRRALSRHQVKVLAVPLLSRAIDEATAFEQLVTWTPADGVVEHPSGLSEDGQRAVRGRDER